ncbi:MULTISPECIES: acyl-CoA dehydrogenase family protein [Sphingobium]|uniref:acyl-CoA dehydrogenase family protein n=1 Tax=Sphingobium sp. MI1205 TaxID=407020 RepID=UPI00076FEBAE|nr:acyl-CoA dehydrogenase [Sphingobium sp. MI1205]AMK19862.1 acyl-coa dehydrogenase protein [Sphingobium sp. MI1205]
MDFSYTSEQESLRDSVKRFVEREFDWEERFRIIRSTEGVAAGHWATFAELGWLGAGLSEEAGGFGGGAIENALIAEELGRGLVTEPFIAHVVATQLLAAIGGDVTADLIAGLVMGEKRIVPALQEPVGRGDWRLIDTKSESHVLNGVKSLVEGGATAEQIIVSARDGDTTSLYLVDLQAPGVTRTIYRTLDNRRVADVCLENVAGTLLASGPEAEAAINRAVEHGIVALCGEALGVMDAALWTTRDYLKVRKQFGTAIANFQALQHRMADMLIETEMTRSILFHALGTMAEGDDDSRAAAVSAAKTHASSGGIYVGAQAIQLHGGIGVTEELNISHYYRRLYVIARQFGDVELHLARFAEATDRTT